MTASAPVSWCVRLGVHPNWVSYGSVLASAAAAIWGFVDRDGVLWLVGEHYARQKPLCHHVQFLPHNVTWYADPSGTTERAELRCADFVVREGSNELRPGIAAVTARLQNGTLHVLEGACPNLLAEAGLYRRKMARVA